MSSPSEPASSPSGPGDAANRIAGAPISWGVCEVPGWGHQLAPQRVLTEMREVGLAATEVGPAGFLPAAPDALARTLADHDLHAVGGFVPVVLHVPGADPVPEVDRVLDGFVAVGATTLVLSADSGLTGYDTRPTLDDEGWRTLLGNLDRLAARATERGITAVLHPHVGTMVETGPEVFERAGVLVREGEALGYPGWSRVTIGDSGENDRVIGALP